MFLIWLILFAKFALLIYGFFSILQNFDALFEKKCRGSPPAHLRDVMFNDTLKYRPT